MTYDDVCRAAMKIAKEGKNPTQSRVRHVLKSRGNSSLNKWLKLWRLSCFKQATDNTMYSRGYNDAVSDMRRGLEKLKP